MLQKGVRQSGKKPAGKRRRRYIQEIFVLYFGIQDSRTPWYAKLTAFLAMAYLISPLDLIPDFIPVAGYLDDLIIVPFILHIAYRLLPAEVKESGWERARKQVVKLRIVFFVILLFFVALLTGIFFLMRSILHRV